ncbi:MAG: hypothetical protein IJI92_04120 [Erysipelotrichaceae bacterium]|nr:hypothetical protein [Erysipelotrichaceae bacterium]
MKCLYCDRKIEKYTFSSLFLKEDGLCCECRSRLIPKRKIINIRGMEVETFFEYDGMFRSLLLQYKECCDEALKDVFLYGISDYINLRYHGYRLLFVPSSQTKLKMRGFDHLEEMFSEVKLKRTGGLKMKRELTQEGRNREERNLMLNNYIYEGGPLKKVLIVDDVVTTGSSLAGVFRTIELFSPKIKVLALAYKKT